MQCLIKCNAHNCPSNLQMYYCLSETFHPLGLKEKQQKLRIVPDCAHSQAPRMQQIKQPKVWLHKEDR